ncbi:50S ribosomal protein L22 [Candidatus Kaiserbacteria bacterium CG10_big_fil_rev_8_21_14_0_10_51_14]|uniref:Large ribosomal subunit protein uL22 n=1 Tax=Candidatus Kaiserbacteria bacterium CG10_big_fil_rev_8_21_14_0_10_51_14 TaxID=1974610 RepID=A0A2H0UBT4_9BACT|nr:MAG: 50S ribosomal protein L22 [Candidatus Kaiserbacteria bacterium CG10_big_fil_rev_8_21_14_0_10_51_14]
MKALLTNYHQSPRKVRLVADLIRGKSLTAARNALMYLPKKSSPAIEKLLDSAVANAGPAVSPESLFVKTITVNKGLVMRRSRPFARGRAGSIRKTMSVVFIELGINPKGANVKTSAKSKSKVLARKTSKKLVSAPDLAKSPTR